MRSIDAAMSRRFVKRAAAAGAALAALTVAGCGFSSTASTGKQSTRVVFADFIAPAAGWALETDDAFVLAKAGVLESLTRTDFDGKLAPALAISWKRRGPATWDFTLQEGVQFHDGSPVDAEAVTQALRHVLKTAAPPRAFSPELIAAVKPAGDGVVRIKTRQPTALLPYYVASPNTGILAPSAYAGKKIDPRGTGTGPFVLTKEVPKQSISLKRNESYWGGEVQLAEAEMRFIPDGGVRATMVQTGEADIVRRLPVVRARGLKGVGDVVLDTMDVPRTTSLYINNTRAPLSDVRVRQALQSAIDVGALAKGVFGVARPAIGPFAPYEKWADQQAKPVALDLARAKALLSQAGIDPKALKLRLWTYREGTELPNLATAVQEMLRNIGVQVEIRVADYAALEPDLLAGKYDLFLMSRSHLIDVGDPAGFLTADYSCKGTYNISQFCDKGFDRQLAEAINMDDENARYDIYRQLSQRLQKDAVNVFLAHEQQIGARRKSIQSYRVDPLGRYVFTAQLSAGQR